MQFIKEELINKEHLKVLERARSTYGFKKQVSVVSEELSELAIVCDKFQRYDDDQEGVQALYDKAAEETADVLVALNHLFEIFQFDKATLDYWVGVKIARLERWMKQSPKLEMSTVDRELVEAGKHTKRESICKGCEHSGKWQNLKPGGVCVVCVENGGINYTPKAGKE